MKRKNTRREFLKQCASLSVAATLSGCRSETNTVMPAEFDSIGIAIGGIVTTNLKSIIKRKYIDYQLVIVDFSKASVKYLSLPFSPHSISLHPQKANVGLAVSMPDFSSRYGYHGDYTKAALIDLHNNEVIRYIESLPQRFFYGHAVFNKQSDEAIFISDNYDHVTKRSDKPNQASLDVIDLQTGRSLDQIMIGGTIVHDTARAQNGRDIIVPRNVLSEKGIAAETVFLNPENKKTERTVRFEAVEYALAHFRQTAQESLFVQAWTPIYSKNKATLLFANKNDEKFKKISHPAEIEKRIFWEPPMEVCSHAKKPITAVSWAKYGFVGFYDNFTGDFISHVDVSGPTAVIVSRDEKYFIVQSSGRFRFIDVETLKENPQLYTQAPHFESYLVDYFKHGLVI